jgi:hypothetical protein
MNGPAGMQVHLLREDPHESMVDLLAEIHAYYNDGAILSREAKALDTR